MNCTTSKRGTWGMALVGLLWLSGVALAQSEDLLLNEPTPPTSTIVGENAPSKTMRSPIFGTIADQPDRWYRELVPAISSSTLAWIAVVIMLTLLLQTRPLLTMRNLDAVVLALTTLLLLLRDNNTIIGGTETGGGETMQFWSYLGLTLLAAYWLFRGVQLAFAKRVPRMEPNVSEGGMLVLIAAGLVLTLLTIITVPLTAGGRDARPGARDAFIGGIYTAETGRLPYGEALANDARSPLLFLTSAGAIETWEAFFGPLMIEDEELDAVGEFDEPLVINWNNRTAWLAPDIWPLVDRAPVRLMNAVLFILMLGAVAVIGGRLHSVALGQMLIVILCVFPGALECYSRPEIMLPATLLAWTAAFAVLPGVGGLLSCFVIIAAGIAWPWAFLALPILLGYWFRHGWHALGAIVGTLAGAAGGLALLTFMTAPALPRTDGALLQAGATPTYEARLAEDGTLVVDTYEPQDERAGTAATFVWRMLLERDDIRLAQGPQPAALPADVSAEAVRFRDVRVTPQARAELQESYRVAASDEAFDTRMWLAIRTVLEATWRPGAVSAPPPKGVWDVWIEADDDGSLARWTLIRRIAKIVLGVFALALAFLLWFGAKPRVHQLFGALLAMAAGALLLAWLGAASNWIWVVPLILASFALWTPESATGRAVVGRRIGASEQLPPPPGGSEPRSAAPRITVER